MLFFIVLSVVLFLTVGSLFFRSTKEAINNSKEKEFISLSHETSNKIERYMFERYGDIQVMVNSPLLKRNNIGSNLKLEYLNTVRQAYKAYDYIFITDSSGKIQVLSGNFNDSGYKAFLPKVLSGETFVSDFTYFKDTKSYGVYYAAPILDESNKIFGAVVERMNFNSIIDIVKNVKLGNNGYAYLMDSKGNCISHRFGKSSAIDNLKDKLNKGFYVTHNNISYFSSLYPIEKYKTENNTWYVVVEQPSNEAFELTYKFKNYTIGVLIISMIIVFVLVTLLSNRITKPIRELLKETQNIAEGDIYKNINIGSTDEIGGLAESFNIMLNNLKDMMRQVLKVSEEAASMAQIRQYADKFFDNVPSAIITIDGNGKITTCNQVACKILKIDEKTYLGKNINSILNNLSPLTKLLSDGLDKGIIYIKHVIKITDDTGAEIPIIINTSVQRDVSEKVIGVIGVFRSVEEMKMLEESITRAKNLESLGALSAGMAHEIKNPLTSIKGYAQYIKLELGPDSELSEDISIIISEVNRLNGILDRFLAFARPKKLNLESRNVNDIIDTVIKLVTKNLLTDKIELIISKNELPNILLDFEQLEQVILNLVVNAIQAMPQGGNLEISTYYLRNSETIEIDIKDTGVGISSEDQDKIFEPFFTTKEKGIGLGLAICARIVENHKGVIELSSTPKVGTTFIIKLPVAN